MKKKIALILAVIIALSALITGINAVLAAEKFTPDLPIYDHDMGKWLFRERYLTTEVYSHIEYPEGTDEYRENRRYYYLFDFTPQYSADYTVSVRCKRKMRCDLYDKDNNLLAYGETSTPVTPLNYTYEFTYPLVKGEQYYYKFYYTAGYTDSFGPFYLDFTSTESDEIMPGGMKLSVINSQNSNVYDINGFTTQKMERDLRLDVTLKDGRPLTWLSKDMPIPNLNNCDIIVDRSTFSKELGEHTVNVYYMGHKATTTYIVEGCLHDYVLDSVAPPKWLEKGSSIYVCSKCGETLKSDFTLTGAELYENYRCCINSRTGDGNFSDDVDLNKDGVINARDFALINSMYYDAVAEYESCVGLSPEDDGYNPVYDLNLDNIIDASDFSILAKTHQG